MRMRNGFASWDEGRSSQARQGARQAGRAGGRQANRQSGCQHYYVSCQFAVVSCTATCTQQSRRSCQGQTLIPAWIHGTPFQVHVLQCQVHVRCCSRALPSLAFSSFSHTRAAVALQLELLTISFEDGVVALNSRWFEICL